MQSPQRSHQWLPSATSVINSKSAKKQCPVPAETPPLRESGADASTASSSSMVYVVGLPAPAFPAFGPQVDWPDTDIGPTSR